MNDQEPFDSTPYDPSDPFSKPRAPMPEVKPMNIQEAYEHLYQVEPFDWEDRADYEARKIAREAFERNLAAQGLTIQALLSMGQITDRRVIKPELTLVEKLIKRV